MMMFTINSGRMSNAKMSPKKKRNEHAVAFDLPAVSVLVPVYNMERCLPRCLESLQRQTLSDIEIVCIDDGSTDSSADILAAHAATDPRIRVITKEKSGYGASMNAGLDVARGVYIGICGPCDFADRKMFGDYYSAAIRYGCDLVKSNYYEHDETCKRDRLQPIIDGFPYKRPFAPYEHMSVIRVRSAVWSALYRADLLRDNEIRFTETPGAVLLDVPFMQKYWICAREVLLLKRGYIHHSVNGEVSSCNSRKNVFAVCGEYASTFSFLRKRGDEAYRRYAPMLNAMRYDAYRSNYACVESDLKFAFVQRWAAEISEAYDEGMFDFGLLDAHGRVQAEELMADPEAFCRNHADGIGY